MELTLKYLEFLMLMGFIKIINNPYPGMLSIYLSQIHRNSEVKVTGSLNRSRDFIYISDIINAFTNQKILNYKQNHIFNLGSGKEVKVLTLLKLLFKYTNKKYKVFVLDKHSGDTKNSHANISLIRKIGWINKISLREGTKKVIKDLKIFDENNSSFNR